MGATWFAADTPLLITGRVATAGVFALWRLWVYGPAFLLPRAQAQGERP